MTDRADERPSRTIGWIRRLRALLWGCVAVAVIILLGWWQVDGPGSRTVDALQPRLGALAPGFRMTTHAGAEFTYDSMRGRPTIMFFGFLNCPDICPTSLSHVTSWLEDLGPDAARFNAVFVSVDPERDTRGALADYLSAFDPRIVGVTGAPAELEKLARPLGIYYRKVPQGDAYTMDHTASVLVLDRALSTRLLIDYHETPKAALAKLRLILSEYR